MKVEWTLAAALLLGPGGASAQEGEADSGRVPMDVGPVLVPGKDDRDFPKVHDPTAWVRHPKRGDGATTGSLPDSMRGVRTVAAPPAALLPAAVESPQARAVVHVDEPGDGNVWARGATYKARFGAEGVEYIPFLGARSPRNFPVLFRAQAVALGETDLPLDAAVPPALGGMRVIYDRGAVVETWELRPGEVEQRFVVSEVGGAGDLLVRIAVETDLPFAGSEAGLAFEVPGLGGVRYGAATIFDARGAAMERAVEWEAGTIEIRVPASFLAAAEFPVTIDPVVTTVAVDTGTDDDFNTDVAYDGTNDVWLVVNEETFSAGDRDIQTRRFTGAGVFLEQVYSDFTGADARRPAVANNNQANQFLVVWDEGSTGSKNIRGRTRDAGSAIQGTTFSITTDAGDEINADVGGDGLAGASFTQYLVVWQDTFAPGDNDIYAQRVSTTGTLGTLYTVDASPLNEELPHTTKWIGTFGFWMIVYRKVFDDVAPPDGDIYYAVHNQAGQLVVGATPVDASSLSDGDPDVAGDGTEFLVVFERDFVSDRDIEGVRYTRMSPTVYANVSGTVGLTALEPGAGLFDDQADPVADTDGCRFVYAYLDETGTGNYDPYAATVFGGASLVWHEGHALLQGAAQFDDEPRIASRAGGGGNEGRYFISWHRLIGAGDNDARGVIYDGVQPGLQISFFPSGCGGASEPSISGTTPVSIGADFTVSTGGITGIPLLEFGLPSATALCPGQGGCVLGQTTLLYFAVPSLTLTIPCNTALIGPTTSWQAVDLLAVGGGGCGPPVWPFTFRISDTMDVVIR
jgi:hypothetical protein